MAKIPECPAYTKPVGKPGDERKHPKGDKVDYTKYTKEHPHTNEGYKKVGSQSVTKGDGKERVRPEKVDYTKYTREHPHTNEGYKKVGSQSTTKGDGAERKESAYKKKSPFRNA